MNFGIVKENKRPYEIREYKRFDEKYTIFSRWVWDKDIIGFKEMKERREVRNIKRKMRGYSLKDYALQHASWTVEDWLKGNTWYIESPYSVDFQKEHLNLSKFSNFRAENAKEMSKIIKGVAKFFGTDLVGIAEIDKRWIYSHYYERRTGNYKHKAIKLPKEYKYGIVMAVEMDLESIKTSPSCIASSATGLGYSKMSFLAIMLAEFIRYLGYKAIPHGNDLSLSIPFAIDAGLGQLGRNGLLITKEYGPNVRISKVFTDLPLEADKPIDFGVTEFCRVCLKCARHCPSRAISFDERSFDGVCISNNEGVLKWYVDAERCFRFWALSGTDCSNCIRSCPFFKPKGSIHDLARFFISNFPLSDPFLVKIDDFLGYGKAKNSERFWG